VIFTWLVERSLQDNDEDSIIATQSFSIDGGKKLYPDITTVDPIYAAAGFADDIIGADETTSTFDWARALGPPLFIMISTNAFPGLTLDGVSITIWLADIIEQKGDATAFTDAVQKWSTWRKRVP
jgi:hypothetical protein